MTQAEIEKRILELKGVQSDYFKTKKAERSEALKSGLDAARAELAELKVQAKKIYRG